VELITIGSCRPSGGGPSTIFGVFATTQFVPVLFTVYFLHELKSRSVPLDSQLQRGQDGGLSAERNASQDTGARAATPKIRALQLWRLNRPAFY
jgi:hypothetical protein